MLNHYQIAIQSRSTRPKRCRLQMYTVFPFTPPPPLHGHDSLRIRRVVGEISGLQNQHGGERPDFKVLLNTFH